MNRDDVKARVAEDVAAGRDRAAGLSDARALDDLHRLGPVGVVALGAVVLVHTACLWRAAVGGADV